MAVTQTINQIVVARQEQKVSVSSTQKAIVTATKHIGAQGPKGDPADSFISHFVAGENVSALRIVYVDKASGKLFYADHTDLDTAHSALGMTIAASTLDQTANILAEGYFNDNSWAWDMAGDVNLFLGANGVITQSTPENGFTMRVGFATSPTSAFIVLSKPIFLT